MWLEDQKIRHYKIEDRQALRNTSSGDWPDALKSVKKNCKLCQSGFPPGLENLLDLDLLVV